MAGTGSPMPWVKLQFFDNNGVPAAGYQLFTYQAGTSTKLTTYSDVTLTTPNANPILLDSSGRATVFLSPTSYKFVLTASTDTDPPSSPTWSQDDVPAISPFASNLDMEGTAGESLAVGNFVYLSDGSGGNTAGRWYKTDADFTYASTAAVVVGAAISGASAAGSFTVRKTGQVTGLSSLTAGTVYYASTTAGALTSSAPTNALVMGKADSTTSLILGASWSDATTTLTGLVNIGAQSFAGVKTFNDPSGAARGQPQTYIGTATTLPATIGGIYFTDVTLHSVIAGQTDSVMSTTTIPANMLSADGKAVLVRFGSSTGSTGANNKTIELDVGGTQVVVKSQNTNESWMAEVYVIRIDSDSVDVLVMYVGNVTAGIGNAQRIDALNFTAAITVRSLGSTGAASTLAQTSFSIEAVG